jgi:SWI/SNF-related matrix-associated actin-dependent regulator of chromatin subfamily A member 5
MREFKKWCPTLRAVKLLGSKEERQHVVNTELKPFYDYVAPPSSSLGNGSHPSVVTEAKKTAVSIPFNVLVTSYESCMREKSAILKMRWKYLVIDEAHRIKNEKSSLAQITRLFRVDHRLLVTGTPLQNNLHELWALLNFLMPEVFSSSNIFDSWFNTDDKEGKENVIKKLHTVLKPFMIRRVKVDVEKDLPPKKEIKLYIGLSAMQKEWYRRVLTKDIAALNALGGPDKTRLLNVLMQLRKVCNHPYLFEGAEFGPPYIDGPHIWESCGKMILLDKLLTRLLATGSRVLIFSQMTRMLDILEDYIRYKRYEYCRIDGNTSGEMREEMMDTFQEEGSTKFVFLLSTRAGGLGINLTTADTVIIYDSDFNPQMDLQAMDRAHRIGQKKEVRVFRFITEGTVEEKIIERADRKLFLDAAVIQQGRLTEQLSNNMNKNELMRMVKFGADAILTNQGGDFTDDDIETLLARGEQRTEDIKGKLQTEAQHTLANFSVQMEDPAKSMNLFEFAGENFLNGDGDGNDKGDAGRLSLGLELGTRERRRSNYDMINYTDDVDLDGNVKEPKEPAVRKLNKKNVFTLPDFQFFDRPRLDEIYTLEAELSAARADQVKAIKKLRHDDEIEMRRQERVARGWNATRNKKPDGRRKENKGIRVTEGGEDTKKGSEDGSDDGADDGEDEEVDDTRQSEGGADTNGIDESTESKKNSEPIVKSDMALEADRLEEELGGDPFPNLATLSLEIQFYHSRALLNKDAQGTGGVGDIVSGKFNIPPAMQREKEQLILAGFPRWTKAHLRAFISGMER